MQSRVFEVFIRLLPLSGPGLLGGLFIVIVLFAFWVVCFFSLHLNEECTGRKKKQSLNIMELGVHSKCTCNNSIKCLTSQQEELQRCSPFCLQRFTEAQFLQGECLCTEAWSELQPSLKAPSVLAEYAALFMILVKGKSLSDILMLSFVVLSTFTDLCRQLGEVLKL